MAKAKEMLDTYPRSFNVDADVLATAIEALAECAMAHCRVCAESCRRCEQACRELIAAVA